LKEKAMAFIHFEQYDLKELEECGRAFVAEFREKPEIDTRKWTNLVLKWFSETCPHDLRSFSHVDPGGEYLVDLCHTTLPHRNSKEGWLRALKGACKCRLALESEWGRKWNKEESLSSVLEDALKLAILQADVKVMLFASQAGHDEADILAALQELRKAAGDDAPWLWIDVPWRDASRAPQRICSGVFRP
jgi:hypothetical protein